MISYRNRIRLACARFLSLSHEVTYFLNFALKRKMTAFITLTMIDELQGSYVTVTLITGSNTIFTKVDLGVNVVVPLVNHFNVFKLITYPFSLEAKVYNCRGNEIQY